jgi:PKD domain
MSLFHRTQQTPPSSVSASRAHRQRRRQRPGLEALEGRQLLSLAGDDFVVDTPSSGATQHSDVASSFNRFSVVVWEDASSRPYDGIYAQMYNLDGSRHGGQIAVEFGGGGASHSLPRVSMDAFGNFVVVYQEDDGGQTNIFARRFDNNGQEVGGRIDIATSSKSEFDPDVVMDAFGNFIVTYTLAFSSTDQDLWAARFDHSTGAVSHFVVSQSDFFDERHSSIAMGGNGQFDIAYEDTSHTTGQSLINLARYDPNGNLLSNGTLQFGGAIPVVGSNPSVAMDNAGNAVVAYQHGANGGLPNQTRPHITVTGIRLNSSGAIVGSTDMGTGQQSTFPDVAMSPSGGWYVVAYETDLIGVPGNTTVEVAEVDPSDHWVYTRNLPAFPNNVGPALSIDSTGAYTLSYTAGVGSFATDIHGESGRLPVAPAAQDLALTGPIKPHHRAALSGQLVDAGGDANLTLTVDWGDGSRPDQSQPGLQPFLVKHRYRHPGTYTVHATWSDSNGLSNSRDLSLVVASHRAKLAPREARPHRA